MKRLITALAFLLLYISGCDTLPIDPYITFNVVRNADFPLPPGTSVGEDTTITARVKIDTFVDYTKTNKSAPSLLRTSEVTKVILHSSDPAFTLDGLVYARLMVGADTVAFDSITQGTGTDFELRTTRSDVTAFVRDTSFVATLGFKLVQPVRNPVTITATMTFVHTATQE